MLNMFLAVNWNSKDAIKFEKKSNPQKQKSAKDKPKTSKFQFKQAQNKQISI